MIDPYAYAGIAALVLAIAAMLLLARRFSAANRLEAQILAFARKFGVEDAAKKFELSTKTVRRLRVFAGDEPRSCATCTNFDLEKGQEALRSDGNISRVTQALTPGAMSRDPTNNQSWSDFGACLKRPGLVLGSTDWCGKFKRKNEQGEMVTTLDELGDTWA